MAERAFATALFWPAWALVAATLTAVSGARVLLPAEAAHAPHAQPVKAPREAAPQVTLEPSSTALPTEDRLLTRLAIAESGQERCSLLERLPASDDARVTYAITSVLDRAQLGSVRACGTRALGRQSAPEAQSWLVDLAQDPVPEVHESALDALATRDDAAARAVVLEATHSEDAAIQSSALAALLKAGREEAFAVASAILPTIDDRETLLSMVDALGQSHDARALPLLESLVEDGERESHLRAITALGELGIARASTRLEALLEFGSAQEFSAAADALVKLAPGSALSKLRVPLASDDDEKQRAALLAIGALDDPEAVSVLSEQLRSEKPEHQRVVLRRLLRKPEPALEAQLVELATQEPSSVQGMALLVLSKLATPSARDAVRRLESRSSGEFVPGLSTESSEDEQARRARLLATLARGEPISARSLVKLADDPSETARDAVLQYVEAPSRGASLLNMLVARAPASLVQRIVQRSSALDSAQRLGVMRGLARRGDPQFAGALRAALHDQDPDTRNAALRGLVDLGDESTRQDVERLTRAEDSSDRAFAVELLSGRLDATAAGQLETLATDSDPQVASAALHALQERSPELAARLAQRAFQAASAEARIGLLNGLSDLKNSITKPLYALALNDTDDSVVGQALQSLTALEGPDSAQRLLAVLNDSNRSREVRTEAASGLRTLGGPLARESRALLDSLNEPEEPVEFTCPDNP